MGRHGKNQTASAVYGYHEKKKDTATSGYGTKHARLGKDSMRNFDCCSLSLQPCRDPVITPDGFLYDRESILESLLHQKMESARKMKEFEEQKKKDEEGAKSEVRAGAQDKVDKFMAVQGSIITKPIDPYKSKEPPIVPSVHNMGIGSRVPSFWIPSLTPQAKDTAVKKPGNKTYCPMSGNILKVKDLTPVVFTLVNPKDAEKKSFISKEVRYKCPVTGDLLGNSVPCAVLKPNGHVVTMECVEKLIRKDMICPLTGSKLKSSDIVPMVRGATGFAGSGLQLAAKKAGAVMTS